MKKLIYSQEDLDLILSLETDKLQSNWNSLREWLEKQISNDLDGIFSYSGRQCKETLDKMNELENLQNK